MKRNDLARQVSLALLISALLAGCEIQFGITQDCGYVPTLIQGTVIDYPSTPVAGAAVVVHSVGVGNCPGSTPMPEVVLTTDDQGYFSKPMVIAGDDRLEIDVSAPACKPETRKHVFYGSFAMHHNDPNIKGILIVVDCS